MECQKTQARIIAITGEWSLNNLKIYGRLQLER